MLTTYFRSSSINTYKMCAGKFALNYVLGIEDKTNKAASKGSLFHKIMECLAHYKLCLQNGEKSFEDDLKGKISINPDPQFYFDLFSDYYAEETLKSWAGTDYEKDAVWKKSDYSEVLDWIDFTLKLDNGRFDPRNQEIVAVERFFDMELPFDWANYNFTVKGQTLSGKLRLRGSVDLIVKVSDSEYILRDYKTGSLVNFNKVDRPTKTYGELCEEFQFRLYYWVAKQFYPGITLNFEAFYPKHGGPYDLYIDDADGDRALQYMKDLYRKIKATQKPLFIKNTLRKPNSGPCSFCSYRKIRHSDSQTVCEYYEQLINENGGVDAAFDVVGDISKLSTYSGGGKNLILEKD